MKQSWDCFAFLMNLNEFVNFGVRIPMSQNYVEPKMGRGEINVKYLQRYSTGKSSIAHVQVP